MPNKIALIVLLLFFFQKNRGNNSHAGFSDNCIRIDSETILVCEHVSEKEVAFYLVERPSPFLKTFRARQKHSKKVIATVLAFPLPFGIVGLHRIYLGSAPYVPVVYIASLGGMFGVLPFIDFCVLLASKKTDPYANNEKIFMWVN